VERWGEMGRDGERWGEMGRDGERWGEKPNFYSVSVNCAKNFSLYCHESDHLPPTTHQNPTAFRLQVVRLSVVSAA